MRRPVFLLGLVLTLAAAGAVGWWLVRVPAPPPWTADMQAAADGNNRFALDLYAQLRQGEGNLVFSPYSAHTALAMTATGARGATRDQMVGALHLPAGGGGLPAAGDLGRFYAHPRADYQLSVANAVWGQTGYPWRPAFRDLQRTRFGSAFHEADFAADPGAARERINGWVRGQTRDRIKDLIPEGLVTKEHRMVLASALYFKGAWRDPFDPKDTRTLPFTLADGTTTPVPTMHREGKFRMHVESGPGGPWQPEFQVAELPYKGGELSMVVLLPGRHDGLPALEAKVTAEALAGWLSRAQEAGDADLYLPKFRIETGAMMLTDPLRRLGMVAAFDPSAADFTGLHSGGERLVLDFVVQQAFVDVAEEGTEAAAATAVGARETSGRLGFRATHPFLFVIRDARHGTILFLGRVQKP